MEKRVKISTEDSDYIEKLFYEYNASLNIIAFLMSKEEVKEKHLQFYLDSSELKYTELEMAKNKIVNFYQSEDIPNNSQYHFDFDKEELIFQVN